MKALEHRLQGVDSHISIAPDICRASQQYRAERTSLAPLHCFTAPRTGPDVGTSLRRRNIGWWLDELAMAMALVGT